MAGMVAMDFVTALAPAVAAADIAIEAGFININDVLRPAFGNNAAPSPQIGDPFLRVTLFVFQRLFLRVTLMCCNAQPMLLMRTPKCCARSRNSASG